MTYPLISRTYFSDESIAWRFAEAMAKLNHYIVSDYGFDPDKGDEPYWVETWNDPFASKDDLLKQRGLIQ